MYGVFFFIYFTHESIGDGRKSIDNLFYLHNALSYGNGASYRLDKQSLQNITAIVYRCTKKTK